MEWAPVRLPLMTPSRLISSLIEADAEYAEWREQYERFERDDWEGDSSRIPTVKHASRQKVIFR